MNLDADDVSFRIPSDWVEAQVWHDYVQALGNREVRPWWNLFDIGGTSFDAIVILSRVTDAVGVHVPLTDFLRSPTVQDLARLVRDALRSDGAPAGLSPGAAELHGRERIPVLLPHGRVGVFVRLLGDQAQQVVVAVPPPTEVRDEDLEPHELWLDYPASVREWLSESDTVASYCAAAPLAIETAVRRLRAGRTVKQLILLDPALEPHVRSVPLWQILELREEDLPRNPAMTRTLHEIDQHRWRGSSADMRRLPELLQALEPCVDDLCRLQGRFTLREQERHEIYAHFEAYIRLIVAISRYPSQPLDVPITLVASQRYGDDGIEKFCDWAGRDRRSLTVVHADGDHYSFLFSEQVNNLLSARLGG
jgi:thioesterase domain-containing protein